MQLTTAFYIFTILIVVTPILRLPQVTVAGTVSKLSASQSVGGLFSGLLKWLLIEYLWVTFEGGQVPFVVMGFAFVYLASCGVLKKNKLEEATLSVMFAEQWVIVLVGLGAAVNQSGIRWY